LHSNFRFGVGGFGFTRTTKEERKLIDTSKNQREQKIGSFEWALLAFETKPSL